MKKNKIILFSVTDHVCWLPKYIVHVHHVHGTCTAPACLLAVCWLAGCWSSLVMTSSFFAVCIGDSKILQRSSASSLTLQTSTAMLVLDVVIWVLLPFLNFLYWLDIGEEAFISGHLRDCHLHNDSPLQVPGSRASAREDHASWLAAEQATRMPPHFSSHKGKAYQKHRGASPLHNCNNYVHCMSPLHA